MAQITMNENIVVGLSRSISRASDVRTSHCNTAKLRLRRVAQNRVLRSED